MSAARLVRIAPDAMAEIKHICERGLPTEAGGILLGYRTETEVVVVGVLEVPDSHAHRFGYTRRVAPAQRVLDAYLSSQPNSSTVGWVGDFHSHPADQPASTTDLRTLRRNARSDGNPLALLVVASATGTWKLYTYVSDGGPAAQTQHAPTLPPAQH